MNGIQNLHDIFINITNKRVFKWAWITQKIFSSKQAFNIEGKQGNQSNNIWHDRAKTNDKAILHWNPSFFPHQHFISCSWLCIPWDFDEFVLYQFGKEWVCLSYEGSVGYLSLAGAWKDWRLGNRDWQGKKLVDAIEWENEVRLPGEDDMGKALEIDVVYYDEVVCS